MKKLLKITISIYALFFAFNLSAQSKMIEKWKEEIVQTEMAFADMAKYKGISVAFLNYAAEDAVLISTDNLSIAEVVSKIEKIASTTMKE